MPSLTLRITRCPPAVAETAYNSAPTYTEGATFAWTLEDGFHRATFPELTVHVTILEVFRPITSSPVMRVRFDTTRGPRIAILKTYDRRMGHYSRMLPGHLNSHPYDCVTDPDVVKFIHEGKSKKLFRDFREKGYDRVKEPSGLRAKFAHWELYFQYLRLKEFQSETQAYERMAHVQGQSIPYFIGSINWRPTCANAEQLKIGAILIEEIQGAQTLREFFPDNPVGHNLYYKIKQQERRLHAMLRERGIIDDDRHEGNTLIVPIDLAVGEFRLLQIDFGFATITPIQTEVPTVTASPPTPEPPDGEMPAPAPGNTPPVPAHGTTSLDLDAFNVPHQQDLTGSRLRQWLDQLP